MLLKSKTRRDIMATSLRLMPRVIGEAAKNLIRKLDNPQNNKQVFDKCNNFKKMFQEK